LIENPEPSPVVVPPGRGGHRPGSGRKSSGYIAKGGGDRTYARALLSALMRDDDQPMDVRARAAVALLSAGRGARKPGQDRRISPETKREIKHRSYAVLNPCPCNAVESERAWERWVGRGIS